MNFKTISDLNLVINKNIHKIPKDIDLIVGIPKSGLLVANLISLYLNLPLTDIDSLLEERILGSGNTKKKEKWIKSVKEARKILLVEDSSLTGTSLKEAKEKLKNFKYRNKIIFLIAYVTNQTSNLADIYFEKVEPPRIFEWNCFQNRNLENACVDIDGVLCVDPTEEENDDGENYKKFIRNAKLRIKPDVVLGTLVTSRLEKYREDTEYWLQKNKIEYKNLIMLNLKNKEERIKKGCHAEFKGKNYKKIKRADIFIESDSLQAEEIASISGKSVFCIENQKFYSENYKNKLKRKYKNKLIKLLPSKIKNTIKFLISREKKI